MNREKWGEMSRLCSWDYSTHLVDEDLGSTRAEQQDSPSERVSVTVELLCAHGGEQTGKHAADVPVHTLKRYI